MHRSPIALPGRDPRRRRFFDDLLVAALQRAVAFAEVDHISVVISEHLDLDVARLLQEFLHIDFGVAESRQRFRLRHVDRIQQRCFTVHDAHSAPAASA
jgi:hypothetical protein